MPRQPFFVFAHDLGQTPLQWEDLVTALPPGVGAACPWLVGTRPGGRAVAFSLADAAAGLIAALDENGVAAGTLVGVGLGGTIALHAAAQVPDRVDRVVAVSAPAQPSRRRLAAQRTALRLIPRRTLADQNIDKDRLIAALKGLSAEHTSDPLAAVSAPVTLVAGEQDRAAVEATRVLARALPGAVVEILPGAAGDLPRTAASALAQIVFADVPADAGLDPWDLS